jgi:hypothetical protein
MTSTPEALARDPGEPSGEPSRDLFECVTPGKREMEIGEEERKREREQERARERERCTFIHTYVTSCTKLTHCASRAKQRSGHHTRVNSSHSWRVDERATSPPAPLPPPPAPHGVPACTVYQLQCEVYVGTA